jgi:hypothetical protein
MVCYHFRRGTRMIESRFTAEFGLGKPIFKRPRTLNESARTQDPVALVGRVDFEAELRDHNPNPQVLACPIPLENST